MMNFELEALKTASPEQRERVYRACSDCGTRVYTGKHRCDDCFGLLCEDCANKIKGVSTTGIFKLCDECADTYTEQEIIKFRTISLRELKEDYKELVDEVDRQGNVINNLYDEIDDMNMDLEYYTHYLED